MGNVEKENRVRTFLIKKYGAVKTKESEMQFDKKKTEYIKQGK
jgi:hypothetical protein